MCLTFVGLVAVFASTVAVAIRDQYVDELRCDQSQRQEAGVLRFLRLPPCLVLLLLFFFLF